MDSCKNCTSRGNLALCLETPCIQHKSWMVKELHKVFDAVPEDTRQMLRGVDDSVPAKYGCHCDLAPGEAADGCYIDTGHPDDCVHAELLLRQGKGRADCEEWRPVVFVPMVAGK